MKTPNAEGEYASPKCCFKPKVSKSRVRNSPSGAVIGVKNLCLFRQQGVKGAVLPCGAWGKAPQDQTRREMPVLSQRGYFFVPLRVAGVWEAAGAEEEAEAGRRVRWGVLRGASLRSEWVVRGREAEERRSSRSSWW